MVCVDCGASISDKFIILGQEVLNSSFYELSEELFQKIHLMIEGIKDMTEEDRKLVRSAVKQLLLISVKEIPQIVKEKLEDE